jgi:hypothetical protein
MSQRTLLNLFSTGEIKMQTMREFQALLALGRVACADDSAPALKEALADVISDGKLLPSEWATRLGREVFRELYRSWRHDELPPDWLALVESVILRTPAGWFEYLLSFGPNDVSVQERLEKLLELKDCLTPPDYPDALLKTWDLLDHMAKEPVPHLETLKSKSASPRKPRNQDKGVENGVKKLPATPKSGIGSFSTQSQEVAFQRILAMARLYYESPSNPILTPRLSPLIAGPTGSGKTSVIARVAVSVDAHLIRLTVGEWIPQGANRELTPSLNLVGSAILNHERVICFVDELDKFCDDGRTWSRSCMTELYGLLERTISTAIVENIASSQTARTEVERMLKTKLFLVGAGAWQSLHDRQPSRAIGFGSVKSGEPQTPLLLRAIKEAGFPSELLGRFHSNPVLLAYPDPDETQQLFRILGLDTLANQTGNMQLLRDFSWSPFGLRSLESLYTDLLLSSRSIEISKN